MKKLFKTILLFLIATFVALIILSLTVFKFESSPSSDHKLLGEMLWISAPDGGIGFRIIEAKHPDYIIRVTCNTPDNVCHEGRFIYTGRKLKTVTLNDISSYFGDDIDLMNGEKLESKGEK
ncbi:hypothetical protein [Vibrio sp. TRT 17S01]|uniref:hypothetical protein n=1 Tax=Vibrio sp. TRT 17S01 TaxID=3418505 RepID=UPI003CF9335C